MSIVIGITGKKRSGKNTLAAMLEDLYSPELSVVQVSFADPLRDILLETDPTVYDENLKPCDPLRMVIEECGWEGVKGTGYALSVRGLLQRLGTAIRSRDPEFFVRAAKAQVKAAIDDGADVVIMPDVRYDNEAEMIFNNDIDGTVVRIERRSTEDRDTHASERGISGDLVDFYVSNNGSIDDLQHQALKLWRGIWDYTQYAPLGDVRTAR